MVRALLLVGITTCVLSPHRPDSAGPPRVTAAVVAHPDVPVDSLRLTELRQILLGDRQFWPDGTRIALLLPATGSDVRAILLERVYVLNEAGYRRHWIAKLFRTEVVAAPKVIEDPAMLAELVRSIPGALGVLPAGASLAGLRVVAIDGMLPGDRGYPLHRGTR